MNLVILMVVGSCCLVGVAVALALRKVASPKSAHPVTPEWIEELSLDRYKPMLRLLDEAEIEALRGQPGFSSRRIAEFRKERIRIFRSYLQRLNADFACICMALKVVMLQSNLDRPDLSSLLLRNQIRFAAGMLLVHARLAFYQLGIGAVDINPLVSLFDAMRFELRQMVPESAVWGS